jgi:integrase/recombinase XerC
VEGRGTQKENIDLHHKTCKIVVEIAENAGISKTISPHRIRHSSVTAALDASDGDVRSVQKLSRHASLNK